MSEAKEMTNLPVKAAEVGPVEMLPGVWRRTLSYGQRLMMVQTTLKVGARLPIKTDFWARLGYHPALAS